MNAEAATPLDLQEQARRLVAAGPQAVREALARLEGSAAEVLGDAIAEVELDAYRAKCAERLDDNADGTVIVRLERPIIVDGEELHRLTVGRVKVRHHRTARAANFGIDAYADELVTPKGAVGELECDADYMAVQVAVSRQLGKFRGAGDGSSR